MVLGVAVLVNLYISELELEFWLDDNAVGKGSPGPAPAVAFGVLGVGLLLLGVAGMAAGVAKQGLTSRGDPATPDREPRFPGVWLVLRTDPSEQPLVAACASQEEAMEVMGRHTANETADLVETGFYPFGWREDEGSPYTRVQD